MTDAPALQVYISSVSSSMKLKQHQQKIQMILDSKCIKYELIDIAVSEDDKQKMRELADNPKALPPQLFNNNEYLGDFDAFEAAVEDENMYGFLRIPDPCK